MQCGKIPNPDGFMVEFFIGFYELLKKYYLLVVKESKKSGKVLGSFNSNLLCLIPRNKGGIYFSDFRPISYCNVIYNLIAKILSRNTKTHPRDLIDEENLSFLQNRKIHDVVLISQEVIY
jgi:hypothetical protein